MLDCQWKSTFGIDCLGCGFQRSVKLLFEGDIVGSLIMYPALIPVTLTLVYCLIHIKFKFKNGARNIIVLFSTTVAIMVINYIYKLFL